MIRLLCQSARQTKFLILYVRLYNSMRVNAHVMTTWMLPYTMSIYLVWLWSFFRAGLCLLIVLSVQKLFFFFKRLPSCMKLLSREQSHRGYRSCWWWSVDYIICIPIFGVILSLYLGFIIRRSALPWLQLLYKVGALVCSSNKASILNLVFWQCSLIKQEFM